MCRTYDIFPFFIEGWGGGLFGAARLADNDICICDHVPEHSTALHLISVVCAYKETMMTAVGENTGL